MTQPEKSSFSPSRRRLPSESKLTLLTNEVVALIAPSQREAEEGVLHPPSWPPHFAALRRSVDRGPHRRGLRQCSRAALAAKDHRLALEQAAAALLDLGDAYLDDARLEVGMGSESSAHFSEFYVAANVDAPHPERIDERLIRRAFGGTIFPPATITVEPLKDAGIWWSEVVRDGEGQEDAYFAPWRALIAWFGQQAALVDAAFVRIGDRRALSALRQSELPEGTEQPGCVLPRLALGLTRAGSLVGLFGYVVQT